MTFRSPALWGAIAFALAAHGIVSPADAGMISVEVDHARVLKVPRPAATVIVGNPAIADVSVQDASTMVLTGRSYGITNLIVLDEDGRTMVDESIGVKSFEDGTVRIYRQAERETLSCSPVCEPTVTIGDNDFAFSRSAGQFSTREGMASGAAK
ncbi:pilus assembly protein N-terminal domain-containing protein [Aureimonas leprariae]|uniref:Pilus assembly protein CpaC n=1 Tax=Plantimonas leprariae TaxID=2615207 RepID=A0A7V7TYG7_9HYPH|nr:pilus assembly protein N-terminal domain-containing protein [Aureimonas leprariae]KAB0682707.1 pilus assembly protein CpaC [Aureimonas leprariae]